MNYIKMTIFFIHLGPLTMLIVHTVKTDALLSVSISKKYKIL